MYKNLKNVFKHPSPEANASTSPARGEVLNSAFNASALNVMLERERSELSRASRNIKSILLNDGNSFVFRFLNVITGLVPVILVQQWINLVNKLAILLHKYRFYQDCRNASGNDNKRQKLSICCSVFNRMYHPGSSANELTLKAKDDYRSVLQYGRSMKRSTRARKFLVDGVQSGRSMIEMLGVLAIIAVLSVGGIAGYSKAMEKFKVNKASEEYAYLIRGLLEYLPNLKLNKTSSQESLVEFAFASNLIPPTWTAIHENKSLLDAYGNNINIFSRNGRLVIDLYLGFQTNPSYAGSVSINFPSKLCVTLFENLVIPLKESLYYAYYINNPGVAYYFYGNNYCSKGRNCLNNLKLNKVNELCSYCPADKSCGIILEF